MKKKATSVPLLALLSLVLTIGLIAGIPTFALGSDAVDYSQYLSQEEVSVLTSTFDSSYQIAFHLYTPHTAIVNRFGDYATPNAEGIYVIYVPVVPGAPRNTWPHQELLTAALNVGHIFSEIGTPGYAFWGWFDGETLDASGRSNTNSGLRRPDLSDTCVMDQVLLQIETQTVDLFATSATVDLFAIWSLWGDVNDDGVVCELDLSLLIDYLLLRIPSTYLNLSAANVVVTGEVCDIDRSMLKDYLLRNVPAYYLGRPLQGVESFAVASEFSRDGDMFRFTVEDTEAVYGDEYVVVTVRMTDFIDPGFTYFRFNLLYDPNFLTLVTQTRRVQYQVFRNYPNMQEPPNITTGGPAFTAIDNRYQNVMIWASTEWTFTTQTGWIFCGFGGPTPPPWRPSEEIITLRQRVQLPLDQRLPIAFGGHFVEGARSGRMVDVAPTTPAQIARFHASDFYAEFLFRICSTAQVGDYTEIELRPVSVTGGISSLPRPSIGGSGYVRIGAPPPPQIAFHLYTLNPAIVDRFSDHATRNRNGIYVINVPVIPGRPYYEWPEQELLQAILEIGPIFSTDGIPGYSFWGWFSDETLGASGRTRDGLRRPLVRNICEWEYGATRALPGIFDLIQDENITALQKYELFGSDKLLNLYAVWTLWGDVNDDGKVDDIDRSLITDYLRMRLPSTHLNLRAADVNFDGVICDIDRFLLRDYLMVNIPFYHLGRPPQIVDGPGFIPGEFRFNIDNATVSQGDEYVYVRINMTEFYGDGFSFLRFGVLYDSNLLTLDISPRRMQSQSFSNYLGGPFYIPGFTDQPAFGSINTSYMQIPLWASTEWVYTTQTGRYFRNMGPGAPFPLMASEETTLRAIQQRLLTSRISASWGAIHPTGARVMILESTSPALDADFQATDFYAELRFRIADNAQVGDYAQISIVPIWVTSRGLHRTFPEQTPEEMGSVTIVN